MKRTRWKPRAKPQRRITNDGREVLTGSAWRARKREVWERDEGKCQRQIFYLDSITGNSANYIGICGEYVPFEEAHIDHIKPRGMGGGQRDDSLGNLRLLSKRCHQMRHELDRKPSGAR